MFNLRHAQARNCIERIFGILKKRFSILQSRIEYPYESQVKLLLALAALHNFILKRNGEEECAVWEQEYEVDQEAQRNSQRVEGRLDFNGIVQEPVTDDSGMKEFHDRLAEQMWIDYIEYVNR